MRDRSWNTTERDSTPFRLLARLRRSLLLTLLGLGVGVVACSDPADTSSDGADASGDTTAADAPPVLGEVPTFALRNLTDDLVTEGSLAGHIWIVGVVPNAADEHGSAVTRAMVRIQRRVPAFRGDDCFRFISLLTDAEANTPYEWIEYTESHEVDLQTWQWLRGDPGALTALAEDGFALQRVAPSSDATRGPSFTGLAVVDSWGRVRGRYDALDDGSITELLADVEQLAAEPRRVLTRDDLVRVPWLEQRRSRQLAAADEIEVPIDFSFVDRQPESGITYRNRPTPDGGRDMKPVHYDHGNGIAVADVDGDGFTDLYFVNQVGRNELWRNKGDGMFEDITERAGVGLRDKVGVTATFADFDGDGDPDLYVTNVRDGNHLFVNDGTGRFRDVTERSGLGHRAHSSAAVAFDYDRDGRLDLMLCNVGVYTRTERAQAAFDGVHDDLTYPVGFTDAFVGHIKPERAERNLIFRNEGDLRFRDVSDELGFVDTSWCGDAAPIDVDQDGWMDLYLLDMQGHDQYWRNREGRSFERRSRDVFPRTSWGAMGIQTFDWDNDGDLDVFVTDMHSDMADELPPDREKEKVDVMGNWPESLLRSNGQSVWGNSFHRNDGDGKFTEISDQVNAETYWPWGIAVGDLNSDGFQDAFITASMNFYYRYQTNSVLLNEGGTRFAEAEFLLGVEPRRDGRTAKPWFRLDADERDVKHKIVVAGGHRGSIEYWDALGSRTAVIFDLEGDGDLDVVTCDFGSEPLVLISDLSERRPDLHHVKVRLEGRRSNRDGLGARVVVRSGDLVQTQYADGHLGYLSHGLLPLYFGLGTRETIDRIEVRWPSGVVQVIEDVDVDATLVVQEPLGG